MDQNIVDSWCESLENVLSDGDALQVFLSWAKGENAEHPLRFHFSVVAYKEMVGKHDERSPKLAREIYKKYLDPQKGVCQFVELSVREQIGRKILSTLEMDESLFDSCLSYIQDFLKKQHAQFVRSDAFVEFLNSLNLPSTSSASQPEECRPTVTPSINRRTITRSRKHKDSNNLLLTQKLTPEVLHQSRGMRELILGQSSVEKMYQPPLTKYPYVCNATTSKNDSAVSSNFSNEPHHKRGNTGYSSSSQQKQHHQHAHRLNALPQRIDTYGSGFRHETEEGRCEFANELFKRLHELDEKINRNERMNEQIQRIDRQAMFSARDVLISAETKIPPYNVVDEDEDLNNYVKQRMIEDSGKPSPSQQQSPAGPQPNIGRLRRRSPKSCSPECFPPVAPPSYHPKFNMMSQSYFDPSTLLQSPKFNHYLQQPTKPFTGFDLRQTKYCDYDEDTSGIGSMATTSQFSASSDHNLREKGDRQQKSSTSRRPKAPDSSDFASLPRQRNSNGSRSLMKISYKASDGVPIVAHIPRQQITLREFRKFLSISSRSQKQFFFKTKSDDHMAPYQLLLVDDDSTVLPLFEGTIAAECRSMCESE